MKFTNKQLIALQSALSDMQDGMLYHGEGTVEGLCRKVDALVRFAEALADNIPLPAGGYSESDE